MIPIILVSSREDAEKFIQTFQNEQGFAEAYTYTITPEKTEITIAQIREVRRLLTTASPEKRLIVLHAFETASLEAQSALLKVLEEKSISTQFLLVAEHPSRIIPTVHSRSKVVTPHEMRAYSPNKKNIELLSSVSSGDPLPLGSPAVQGISRDQAIVFLKDALFFYRDRLQDDPAAVVPIMKQILKTLSLLENNNLNPQLSVDSVLIFISKTSSMKRGLTQS
jgi:hypothetical protein